MLADTNNIPIDSLTADLYTKRGVKVLVARLDKVHPVVSGNKLFKLHFFLEEALKHPDRPILTYGGTHSNHLVATAFACREMGLKSIGIVRGESPAFLSPTLKDCIDYGMQLRFISRTDYSGKDENAAVEQFKSDYGNFTRIPEGGYHPLGRKVLQR